MNDGISAIMYDSSTPDSSRWTNSPRIQLKGFLWVESRMPPSLARNSSVSWLNRMMSHRLKLEMNRDLIHVFMAVLEPRLVPAHSFLSHHSTDNHVFVCEYRKCQIKCLYVVSHLQKSLSYTSGCKQSEQGSKSEDPELERPHPANQDVLSGEFCFSDIRYVI